jgi:anti-sigma factor RsiW
VIGSGREMTCLEFVELATDYLEDRLAPEDRQRFEHHVDLCPGCQAYMDQLRQTLRALGRIPPESISREAEEELLRAFRDWQGERPG